MLVTLAPPNPEWPAQFTSIASSLRTALSTNNITPLSIEHIGSTSIPHLPAKPVIDIAIIIASAEEYPACYAALCWGGHEELGRRICYYCIDDGGVEGRWSFKMYLAPFTRSEGEANFNAQFLLQLIPRNVYVVVQNTFRLRCWIDFRDVLLANDDLRDEYASLKQYLVKKEWPGHMEYATAKSDFVAKVLRLAGWTEEEIKDMQGRSVGTWYRGEKDMGAVSDAANETIETTATTNAFSTATKGIKA